MDLVTIYKLIQTNTNFYKRIRTAALVAAAGVEWVAKDYDSADAVERASRRVLSGGDLSKVVLRCAAEAHTLNIPTTGSAEDGSLDVQATDEAIITLVTTFLVSEAEREMLAG